MALPSVGGEFTTSLATQNADAVAITGGTITGVTLSTTGGTMTTPTLTTPTITGGTIDNNIIGGSTPAAITGTTVVGSTSVATAGTLKSYSGTAPGAGSGITVGLTTSSTANLGVFFGTGDPSMTVAKGSIYMKTDAGSTTTRLFIATDAAGTWAHFTASA